MTIVYRYVPRYRAPFYEQLRSVLADRGVELRLAVGQPTEADESKGDAFELPWAYRIRNRRIPFGKKGFVWQPAFPATAGSELVIVEQATRLLYNYLLLAESALLGKPLVAFWGHGANFQKGQASPIGEWLKSKYSTRADWWFAYNECSASIVRAYGYDASRITVVRNAIDDVSLRRDLSAVTDDDLREFRREHGIKGGNVCLFIGSMYPEKRVGLLLDAARLVRREVPDFELLLIGAGPDALAVQAAATQEPWLHFLGAEFDSGRALALRASKLLLVPGAVGLVVLDSFVAGVPLVTAVGDAHGPEYDYIEPGTNAVVVDSHDSSDVYASAVIGCLRDRDRLNRLRDAALDAGETYPLSGMVERFADGIFRALEMRRKG